jgi:dihydroorotate dehydrogenase electron transfer subunit
MIDKKIEQPIAVKIAEVRDEAKNIRSFRFNYRINAKPGQFILLWIPRLNLKPFGVSRQDSTGFEITVCKVGPFTEELFKMKVGDYVGIQGPYGKPFSACKKNSVLVAGGYGAAPLAFLADELAKEGGRVNFIIGAKTADSLVYKTKTRFNNPNIKLTHTTDDGSGGRKGFTTDVLKELLQNDKNIDMIFTCGPEVMMKKVIELSDQYCIDCEASLERYMKCGFGICGQCCTDHTGIRLCKEGPVFSKDFIKEHISEFNKHKRDATGKKILI